MIGFCAIQTRKSDDMRILNVVSVLSGREGGGNAERTVQLSRALTENGTACVVLTLDIGDPQGRVGQLGGARLVVVPCLNRRFQVPWPEWRRIRKLVEQADVIHLMGHWSLLGVLVHAAALKAGVPYVVSPAGALPLFGRSQFFKRFFNFIFGRRLIGKASGWIAVTRSELPDFEMYGVHRDRIVVIPNGVVESDLETPDGTNFNLAPGIPSGRFILFMGRLNSIKGPDLLLEAFSRVAKDFPDVSLVFAGPDEGMGDGLERNARTLGLAGRVSFTGFISGYAKAAAYRGASLLVVPSRLEAMSIVAVEGGVCGTPVLMTDQCGLDDLREVEPGLVVPASADGLALGLRLALEDPQRLVYWGKRWQALVQERFLWRDLGRRFGTELERIAARKEN